MKRSDGIMGQDQESRRSPSAKRRSIQTTEEFNIFESEGMRDKSEGSMYEQNTNGPRHVGRPSSQSASRSISPAVQRRSSSLRRSAVQQRQTGDRSIFARSRVADETFGSLSFGTPSSVRPPPRMPLDGNNTYNSTTDKSRLSLRQFSGGSLFSENVNGRTQPPQRSHPLSRTITQSSSGSSFADDSPTHEPAHHKGERPPRIVPGFSRSLPIGTSRPTLAQQITRQESACSTDSFATPENYKHAKPLLAAFMSTGLISKKNRNVEDPDGSLASSKNMPDTPCKRTANSFPAGPKMQQPEEQRDKLSASSSSSSKGDRPFDIPASPLNLPTRDRPKSGAFARGMSIFDSIFNRQESTRPGSAVSLEDEEHVLYQSPSAVNGSQRLTECDFPPTPTKQSFFPSKSYPPPGSSSQSPSFEGFGSVGANCKWRS